jgi:hypothetical protein
MAFTRTVNAIQVTTDYTPLIRLVWIGVEVDL